MRPFLRLASAAFLLIAPSAAIADVCDVDVTRAYESAVRNGWRFSCDLGVLHFNSAKQPGCSVRAAISGAYADATFFDNASVPDKGKNGWVKGGWRITDFEVAGGQWIQTHSITPEQPARVTFAFKTKAGTYVRRYLSRLTMAKKNGDCARVYDEAF